MAVNWPFLQGNDRFQEASQDPLVLWPLGQEPGVHDLCSTEPEMKAQLFSSCQEICLLAFPEDPFLWRIFSVCISAYIYTLPILLGEAKIIKGGGRCLLTSSQDLATSSNIVWSINVVSAFCFPLRFHSLSGSHCQPSGSLLLCGLLLDVCAVRKVSAQVQNNNTFPRDVMVHSRKG